MADRPPEAWKINSRAQQERMSFLIEFWRFLKVRKKYWLVPVIVLLLVFGALVVLSQGSAVAPFIYTLF